MKPLDIYAQAKEQLHNLSPNISLAILHPDFHGQHRLFGSFLKDNKTVLYVPVAHSDTTAADLRRRLENALHDLTGEPVNVPADPDQAAAAVAGALESRQPYIVLIDGYDLLDPAKVTATTVALTQKLPEGSRLLLAGRELPMALIEHEALRGKSTLVPTNPDKMMLDYAQSHDKTLLEVRALGPGRVLINGRLVDHWDGVLPRTLFFYFVDRGMTTRDEIFQTFWPNLSTREATNVFHVTKRKISEILGTDLTIYWSGFYRISPDLELHYDVIKFAEAVQNAAVADDDEALRLLNNAIALYNGPFLSTISQSWVTQRREELALTYAEALAGLARTYQRQDDLTSALGCYLRAAAISPQREDLARSIMEIYRDLGQPDAAIETYQRLENELQQSLKVAPGPQTAELADKIRASR